MSTQGIGQFFGLIFITTQYRIMCFCVALEHFSRTKPEKI